MNWKHSFRSIYCDGAPEPADLVLHWAETALLVIDVRNTYLARPDRASLSPDAQRGHDAWTPFHVRMRETVIPRTRRLLDLFRRQGIERLFARIACHTRDDRNRSLSQKMPGWNNLSRPKGEEPSQLVPELAPVGDEIVVTKTTGGGLLGCGLGGTEIEIINMIYGHVVSSAEFIAMMGFEREEGVKSVSSKVKHLV